MSPQVLVASLLGSPLAGAWLLYRAERRASHLVLGLALTAAVVLSLQLLPHGWVGWLLAAPVVAWRGRRLAGSWLWAVGTGLLFGLPLLVLNGALFFWLVSLRAPRDFAYSPKSNVCLYRGVTLAEARQLGDGLKRDGYFNELEERSVDLLRDGKVFRVRIWLPDEGWTDPATLERYRLLAATLSRDAFGGQPVVIDLMDRLGDRRATVP